MGFVEELRQQMAGDLNIYQFEQEDEKDYIDRLLFSGIGQWIQHSGLDSDLNDSELYRRKGVSKKYITIKNREIVTSFVSIYPSFINYYKDLSIQDFIMKIRSSYEQAGYFIPAGFSEYLIPAPIRKVKVNHNLYLVRNDYDAKNSRTVGLGQYATNVTSPDNCDLADFFKLPSIDALNWFSKYVQNLTWSKASNLGENTLFFDMRKNKSNYQCWGERFPVDCDVTLYKTNDWDYGFASKRDGKHVGIAIPEYLIGIVNSESERFFNNDVRRFMFGLKALYKNPVRAKITMCRQYSELKLFNKLPERENIALKFLGWRKSNFMNEYNYCIPNDLLDSVKSVLENLSIEIEVN